jgi:hypothetical protein
MKNFEENKYYYLENGAVVFTALFHLERGTCCGNKCRHCPDEPQYLKGNKQVDEEHKLKT